MIGYSRERKKKKKNDWRSRNLLALVHNFFLRAYLHGCQGLDVRAVIAKAGCYLLVEGVNEILETAAEGAERPLLQYIGTIFVRSRWLVRVTILSVARV